VHDPRRIAPIREHPGQIVGQTETPLGHARSITPPFEVRRPPSKAAVTFLA
jgi:hypothetical protein